MNLLKTALIKELYFSGVQSIAELSEATQKSIPSITKVVKNLLDQKLICENELRASTGGRRAKSYRLCKENHGNIIAVAIDQYFTSVTVFNVHNEVIHNAVTIETDLKNDKESFSKINNLILDTIKNLTPNPNMAIGINMPGFVDSAQGINNSYRKNSPLFSLRNHIQKNTNIPTFIENDSSSIAIAEKHLGHAKNNRKSLVINLTWGVGLGIIVENQLFKGSTGFAGEFSHIPLANENKLCSCGKNGCLEVEASLRSAMNFIIENIEKGEVSQLSKKYNINGQLMFDDIVEAYHNGDQLTIKAIKQIAHMLGKGIATLIHILNPELVLISGKGAVFGNILLSEINSAIQEYCIPRLAAKTKIEISTLKNVQLIAAACIAVQQMK